MIDHLKAYSYLCGALTEIIQAMGEPSLKDRDWPAVLHDAMVAAERYGAVPEKDGDAHLTELMRATK